MKNVVVLLLSVFLAQSALAEVRPEYSGAWFNPDQSGHGFSLEVISPQRTVAFWYAYDPFGNPIFLYADGVNVGDTIQAKVYYLQGMIWGEFDPDTNSLMDWGTLTITFHGCRSATLTWDSVFEYDTGEAYGSGEIPLVKLSSMEGLRCSDHPLAGVYGGFAYSETENTTYPGYGVVGEDGRFHYISGSGMILNADLTVPGGTSGGLNVGGTAVFFVSGVSIADADFFATGTYNPDMIGAWFTSAPIGGDGNLELHRLARATGRTVTLDQLSGPWTAYNYLSGLSAEITVSPTGAFMVTDVFGCVFDGQLAVPNPDLNLLHVTTAVSNCPYASGTFTGAGALLEDENINFGGDDAVLMIAANSEGDAIALRLTRP